MQVDAQRVDVAFARPVRVLDVRPAASSVLGRAFAGHTARAGLCGPNAFSQRFDGGMSIAHPRQFLHSARQQLHEPSTQAAASCLNNSQRRRCAAWLECGKHGPAQTAEDVLTLVTCYPFYCVGPAPKRFVARARQASPQALARSTVE